MADIPEGSPSSWTLRFKHGRTTILLYCEPLTPLSALIAELLDALRDRYPEGLPSATPTEESMSTIPIPQSTSDIRLATLVDVNDTSRGWTELELSGGPLKDSVKGVGLKDGGILAYRFVSGSQVTDTFADEDEKTLVDGEGASTGDFDVQWPSYDESYPEEEEEVQERGGKKRKLTDEEEGDEDLK